jgi:hypothetical protein
MLIRTKIETNAQNVKKGLRNDKAGKLICFGANQIFEGVTKKISMQIFPCSEDIFYRRLYRVLITVFFLTLPL